MAGTAEQFPNGFSAAVNESGKVAFAWTWKREVRFRMRATDGDLGPSVKVSTSGRAPLGPAVALDSRGNAIVSWHERVSSSAFRVYAAGRPRGGRFGKPQSLGPSLSGSPAGDATYPLVGYDPSGNALLTWRRPTDLAVAVGGAGHRFDSGQRLDGVNPLAIAFRSDGTTAVLFSRLRGETGEAAARPRGRFAIGDPFQPPIPQRGFADVGASDFPRINGRG